jgi:hypothetical protein
MKTEVMNIVGKGVCIVISELNFNELADALSGDITRVNSGNAVFSNVYKIADEIRARRKIAAIKETRAQTGWGLKEAKEYIDKFIPPSWGRDDSNYDTYADNFLRAHMPENFIADVDFKL